MFLLRGLLFVAIFQSLTFCCTGRGQKGITTRELYNKKVDWSEALQRGGINQRQAWSQAVFWLIFFHWLQPLAYFVALYTVWDEIDVVQHWLGGVVAAREVVYFVSAGVAAIMRPEYLLVSLSATISEHGREMGFYHLLVYVMSPEKTVGMTLAFGDKKWRRLIVMGILMLDAFALLAFLHAFLVGVTPPALMLGYVFTIIGGVGTIGILFTEADPAELKQQGWTARRVASSNQFSSQEMREVYTAGEMKSEGYSVKEVAALGYSCRDVREVGYSVQQVQDVYGQRVTQAADYSTCDEAREAGYSCTEVKAAGYADGRVLRAGYSLEELREAGFPWYTCTIYCRATYGQLVAAGYTGMDSNNKLFFDYAPLDGESDGDIDGESDGDIPGNNALEA